MTIAIKEQHKMTDRILNFVSKGYITLQYSKQEK